MGTCSVVMFQLQRCNVSILGGYHRIPKNLLYSATQQQQPVAKHRQQQRHGHQGDGHQPKQSEYSTDSDDCEFISAVAFPLSIVTNSYCVCYSIFICVFVVMYL